MVDFPRPGLRLCASIVALLPVAVIPVVTYALGAWPPVNLELAPDFSSQFTPLAYLVEVLVIPAAWLADLSSLGHGRAVPMLVLVYLAGGWLSASIWFTSNPYYGFGGFGFGVSQWSYSALGMVGGSVGALDRAGKVWALGLVVFLVWSIYASSAYSLWQVHLMALGFSFPTALLVTRRASVRSSTSVCKEGTGRQDNRERLPQSERIETLERRVDRLYWLLSVLCAALVLLGLRLALGVGS